MTSLPPISQVAGAQLGVYENLWRQVDVSGKGLIDGATAASFFKKSRLQEGVLHQIWNLSDCYGRGYLDKQGFFVALKLVALAQAGMAVDRANLTATTPSPVLDGFQRSSPGATAASQSSEWAIGAEEKQKYDGIFQNLGPTSGKLSGDVVKPVMMNSKLPVDTLSKIWEMSDIDQDGHMDSDEFAVVMHLIYKALDGHTIPPTLPSNLIPPSKRRKLSKSPPILLPPTMATSSVQLPSRQSERRTSKSPSPARIVPSRVSTQASSAVQWVVSASDKAKYDNYFNRDKASDGYISGDDARRVFLQSGLQNVVLGQIWELCDINKSGRLNSEEFALAMYLISEKLKGVDPPTTLTAAMIPPSCRQVTGKTDSASSGVDTSMMKELDQISQGIEELRREKSSLEDELQKREESVRQKSVEVQALQVELDTSSSNLKDLETLKMDSKSRLEKMDEERAKYEGMVAETKQKCRDEEDQIARLKAQLANQDISAKAQEEELSKAQDELQRLQNDEKQLLQEIEAGKEQLDSVIQQITATQTEMTQVRSRLADLHSTQRSITAALAQYSSLAGGTAGQPLPTDLTKLTEPADDALSARATAGSSPVSTLSAFSNGSMADKETDRTDDFKDDPFKTSAEPFASTDDPFSSDPFNKGESGFPDPFGGDPFKNDPFKSSDPFKATQTTTKVTTTPGNSRAGDAAVADFSGFDPFTTQPFKSQEKTSDPFGMFGSSSVTTASSLDGQPPKLPPKRSVGSKPPTTTAAMDMFSPFTATPGSTQSSAFSSDPFGGSPDFGSGGGGFAKFATFPSGQSNTASAGPLGSAPSSQAHRSPSDDDMLAWVKAESIKEEQERQQKQQRIDEEEEQQFRLALHESVQASSEA